MMAQLDELAHRKILGMPIAVVGGILGLLVLILVYWRSHVSAATAATTSSVPNAGAVNDTDLAGDGSASSAGSVASTAATADDGTDTTSASTDSVVSQLTDWGNSLVQSLSSQYTSGKSADATTVSTSNQSNLVYSKAPNNPDIYVTDTTSGVSSYVSKAMWDLAGDPAPTSTAAPPVQLVKNSLDSTVYQVHGDGSQTYVPYAQYQAMGSPTVATNNTAVKAPTLVKSANDATIYSVNPITGAKTALTYAQWSAAGSPAPVIV